MSNPNKSLGHKIDKKCVSAMAIFAMNNIPDTDKFTLRKFLELIHTTGSFGLITDEQLIAEMRLMIKYIPDTCKYSLFILLELLSVYLPFRRGNSYDFLIAPKDRPKLIDSGQKIVSPAAFQKEHKP